MCSSQYWVEKYIGWVMERTNTRHNAAQSMTTLAIYGEAFKNYSSVQLDKFWKERVKRDTFELYQHLSLEEAPFHPYSRRFLDMLGSCYIIRKHNEISKTEAKDICEAILDVKSWKRIRLPGDGQSANVFEESPNNRSSCYVAVEMDSDGICSDVYYDKILQMHTIFFDRSKSSSLSADYFHVVLLSWASGITIGNQKQLFKEGDIDGVFYFAYDRGCFYSSKIDRGSYTQSSSTKSISR